MADMAPVPAGPTARPARPVGVAVLSGASAGLVSALLFQPLDLVKTRMQVAASLHYDATIAAGATTARRPLPGTTATLRHIAHVEGPAALWTGLGASVIRLGSGIGLYFGTLTLIESALAVRVAPASDATVVAIGPAWQSFAVGTGARCLSGLVVLPVTVVKARLESGLYHDYGGFVSGLRTMAQREGSRGLFAGLAVTLLRDAPSSGVFYVIFRRMQAVTGSDAPTTSPAARLALNACSGVVAGATTSLMTQPLDVVKTQMQTRTDGRSLAASFAGIVRQQGVAGLMAGFVPRASRRTLLAAVSWTVYEYLNPVYRNLLYGPADAIT